MKTYMKGKLVCFIGIDGSGKTSLAKSVVKDLKNNGIECNYCYGRYKPLISKPVVMIGKTLFLRNEDVRKYNSYSATKRRLAKKYNVLMSVYYNMILIDYAFQIFVKIIVPRLLGKTIICDRYVYDTVINDMPRSSDDLKTIKMLVNRCLRIAPEPDIKYFIDIDEGVAYKRKNDTPSINYLIERRMLYKLLACEYKMTVLDGTSDFQLLNSKVVERILE